MFHYIDPFLWQLVIVPTFTIGLGIAIALRTERTVLAPLVTFLAYLGMEWFMYRALSFSSWWLLFPLIAYGVAYTFSGKRDVEQRLSQDA